MTQKRGITPHYDLAIIGGGIVGTTLAVALKDTLLNVVIIESQSLEQVRSRRQAYALSLLSGRILNRLGVWSNILPQIGRFNHISLSDADFSQTVQFETQDLGTEDLGYVGEHSLILGELQRKIAQYSHVHWICPAKVMEIDYRSDKALITFEKEGQRQILQTSLVIGADGAKSNIRQWANIQTRGWKYWQSCVAFTVKHYLPQNNIAFERFCESGPMGILPLPDNRCQIVWTAPHAEAQTLYKMDKDAFLAQLQTRTKGILGKVDLVSDRFLFPVQLMQSNQYVKPRLALVGDAAHCCHPVGGQGLNLGIRDAAALAQVLGLAAQNQEDLGNINVLKRYERWRKWENFVILGMTDLLDRTFSNSWLPLMVIRRFGLILLRQIPPLKRFTLQLMTGLKGKMPSLAQH